MGIEVAYEQGTRRPGTLQEDQVVCPLYEVSLASPGLCAAHAKPTLRACTPQVHCFSQATSWLRDEPFVLIMKNLKHEGAETNSVAGFLGPVGVWMPTPSGAPKED